MLTLWALSRLLHSHWLDFRYYTEVEKLPHYRRRSSVRVDSRLKASTSKDKRQHICQLAAMSLMSTFLLMLFFSLYRVILLRRLTFHKATPLYSDTQEIIDALRNRQTTLFVAQMMAT